MDCGGKTLSFAAEWIVLISFRNKFGNSQREEGGRGGEQLLFLTWLSSADLSLGLDCG